MWSGSGLLQIEMNWFDSGFLVIGGCLLPFRGPTSSFCWTNSIWSCNRLCFALFSIFSLGLSALAWFDHFTEAKCLQISSVESVSVELQRNLGKLIFHESWRLPSSYFWHKDSLSHFALFENSSNQTEIEWFRFFSACLGESYKVSSTSLCFDDPLSAKDHHQKWGTASLTFMSDFKFLLSLENRQ